MLVFVMTDDSFRPQDNLNFMLHDLGISHEQRRRCRLYFYQKRRLQRLSKYHDLSASLSDTLRRELKASSYLLIMKKVWFIALCPEDLLQELTTRLQPMLFAPHEPLDFCNTMFIMLRGITARLGRLIHMVVLSCMSSCAQTWIDMWLCLVCTFVCARARGSFVRTMSKDAIFGADDLAIGAYEECPFAAGATHRTFWPCEATLTALRCADHPYYAVALTFVEVLALERVTIEDLLDDYPEGRSAFIRARNFYKAQHAFRRFAHKIRGKTFNAQTVLGYRPKRQSIAQHPHHSRRISHRPSSTDDGISVRSTYESIVRGDMAAAAQNPSSSSPGLGMPQFDSSKLGAILDAINEVRTTTVAQNAAMMSAMERHVDARIRELKEYLYEINEKLERQHLLQEQKKRQYV